MRPLNWGLIHLTIDDISVKLSQGGFQSIMELTTEKQTALNDYMNTITEASVNFKPTQKRHSKVITDPDQIKEIAAITHTKARHKDTIMQLFGNFTGQPKYQPYDIVTIPAKTFGGLSNNKDPLESADAIGEIPDPQHPGTPRIIKTSTKVNTSPFTTGVGLFIFNRIFIEPFSDILGYVNKTIGAKFYKGKINVALSQALLEDKITVKQLRMLIEDSQIIMSCASSICPSHTEKIFTMQEQLTERKKKLLSDPKIKKGIDSADLVVMKNVEDDLINYAAKELLKDDPSMDMYNSDAKATLSNNFKNMYIMRSGLTDVDGKTTIVMSSYMDGMEYKDYTAIGGFGVRGSYSRSCMTAGPGHIERLFLGATSHIKSLGKGTDCHTNRYVTVKLTDKNIKDWYYSFIIDDGTILESSNDDSSIDNGIILPTDDHNHIINIGDGVLSAGAKDVDDPSVYDDNNSNIEEGLTEKDMVNSGRDTSSADDMSQKMDQFSSSQKKDNPLLNGSTGNKPLESTNEATDEGRQKLIELLPSNASQFIGKTLKFRFSSLCEAPAGYVCEVCLGTLLRRLNLDHSAGLLSPIAMSALKNNLMKSMHVNVINLYKLDLEKIFS